MERSLLFGLSMRAILVATLLALPVPAFADIVMIDVNDQSGERAEIEALARKSGQRSYIVQGVKTKDMLRNLEEVFAAAERGEIDLETLVLSGHSDGSTFFSKDGDRELLRANLDQLRTRYPKAFGQVRNLMLLGCFTGLVETTEEWQDRFPSVILVAGFNGRGPSGAPSEKFVRRVLMEAFKQQKKAGNAETLASKLDQDPQLLRDYQKALESLMDGTHTSWGMRLCTNFHTNIGRTTDAKAEILFFFDHYEACMKADASCRDPREANRNGLARLYTLNEQHERARASNRDLYDRQQERLRKLLHYSEFIKQWRDENAEQFEAARLALGRSGVLPPSSDQLGIMTREEHLGFLRTVEGTAATLPPGEDRATLESFAARVDHDIRLLKEERP